MNGNKMIYFVSALTGLVGILLVLLLSSMTDRIDSVEETLGKAFRDGRLETPEQKTHRTTAVIQRYWTENIRPELRAMEERIMRAIENGTEKNDK